MLNLTSCSEVLLTTWTNEMPVEQMFSFWRKMASPHYDEKQQVFWSYVREEDRQPAEVVGLVPKKAQAAT